MKKFVPHIGSIVLVTVGVLIGSTLTGNNAVAQKITALSGSGIQDHLAKWINGSGTLGTSSISEDKQGNLTIGGSIKFKDGSIQSSAAGNEGSITHHQELTIVAQPSESPSFALPRQDFPVNIEISTSVITEQFPFCNNPGVGTSTSGPLLLNVVAVGDSLTGRISVLGGFFGDEPAFWRAQLRPNEATQKLVITILTSCATPSCCSATPQYVTSGPITYHISMWY